MGAGDRTTADLLVPDGRGTRYVIRLEHTTTRPFQDAQLRCVPEGFILVRGSTSEIRGERSLAYRRGEDASFTLMQTQGEDLVGSKGTACQGSEVEVNGLPGPAGGRGDGQHRKRPAVDGRALHLLPSMGRACPPKSCWRLPGM